MTGFAAWWAAWKWVAILLVLLLATAGVAIYLGLRLYSADVRCDLHAAEAASKAVEAERQRALEADKAATSLASQIGSEVATAIAGGQGNTNARDTVYRTVTVRGDYSMPAGLPSLQPAIDEANAAAR